MLPMANVGGGGSKIKNSDSSIILFLLIFQETEASEFYFCVTKQRLESTKIERERGRGRL